MAIFDVARDMGLKDLSCRGVLVKVLLFGDENVGDCGY